MFNNYSFYQWNKYDVFKSYCTVNLKILSIIFSACTHTIKCHLELEIWENGTFPLEGNK